MAPLVACGRCDAAEICLERGDMDVCGGVGINKDAVDMSQLVQNLIVGQLPLYTGVNRYDAPVEEIGERCCG